MLSDKNELIIYNQLKYVLENAIPRAPERYIDDLLGVLMPTLVYVLRVQECGIDPVDEASCSPTAVDDLASTGSEVRCPHCARKI